MKKLTRTQFSWVLYDLAFSAFAILQTAILPLYLKNIGRLGHISDAVTTSQWGLIQTVSTAAIALLAPILGAVAEFKGMKKILFNCFLIISIAALGVMAFIGNYNTLLIINLICSIGYTGTGIVYDSYIIDVTTNDDSMNFLSSFGFAIGYWGRCIPFIISILLMTMLPFGITSNLAIQISIGITALWWLGFSYPMLRNVKQVYGTNERPKNLIRTSFKNVWLTLKKIMLDKRIALFLLAYFFYIDGVNTLITMSTEYGADVGINQTQMVLALLATQIIAAPSVMLFEHLAKVFSTKKVILFSIAIFASICSYAFFMTHAYQFWIVAIATALVLGTIQALSRSYFGQILPDKNQNNEYFGFYNILGRYSSFVGTGLISLFTIVTGSSRFGILSIVTLFVIGFVIFLIAPKTKIVDAKVEENFVVPTAGN